MKKIKLLSTILTASMLFTLTNPLAVRATTSGEFENSLPTIQRKAYNSKKFTSKPLVILIDFPDYKYTDLDKREKNFRINNFKGAETTDEFYENLFFGDEYYETSDGNKHITVNKFFKEESGGTYEFKGKVVGWYTADKKAKEYGSNDGSGDQPRARNLVKESIEKASKDLDLSEFDVEDKWDLDGDGNYNEPDGIIDSLVVIHPGLGEEWGGGSLGEDAIWPFRWGFNVFGEDMDKLSVENKQTIVAKNPTVKDRNGKEFKIEDFAVFEQDLPVDLFNHEFGHILGLPDLYGTNEPPVENWSIMGGSYAGDPRGSEPVSYGAYCREFLQKDFTKRGRIANWQNSEVLNLENIDEKGIDVVLDQASIKGQNNDTIRINLPECNDERVVTPPEGKYCYFSGKGDNLENYMSTKSPIELMGKNKSELSFRTWYNIDPGFDFASVQVKEVGTNDWISVRGNLTTDTVDQWVKDNETPEEIKRRNPGHGITGSSNKQWVDATFDLSNFKGRKVDLRFRFRTDSNTPEDGIYMDDIKVNVDGQIKYKDNAESDSMFNFDGFSKSNGVMSYNHYYLLEWRNSGGDTLVDKGLKTINIGRKGLEYDPGLVVWYINEKYAGFRPDQNTANHKGELFAGIVDADQNPVTYRYEKSGKSGADRINYQMHDAAFSLRTGSALKIEGKTSNDKYYVEDNHTFMNPVFSDDNDYTASSYNREAGLKLKKYGLKVFVTDESKDRSTAKIHIARFKDGKNTTAQDSSILKEVKVENNKLYVEAQAKYGDMAYIEYLGKNNKKQQVTLNYENGKYVGEVNFLSQDSSFKISHIVFIDAVGNAKAIYNNEVHKIFGADFTKIKTSTDNETENSSKEDDKTKVDDANNKDDTNTQEDTIKNTNSKPKESNNAERGKSSEILAKALPKTGGVTPMENYILGMILIASGIIGRKKLK
ncbi:immune inhibitor A domain-containing protein [Haloimpatiens massiliensis]|uniref:immune inhibitor A domain-containing protein n=1 Tax=Haloimpatiens massiliensis TaxID=1658110 RepID=UPI000C845B15|nr:immune inhibitor A domain-containing protein [Haloimpatiens massiliensis]